MSEQRRAKRRKVGHSIEVVDTMTEQVIGRVSNLSESGMMLIMPHRLTSDALYQLRMRLADHRGVEHTVEVGAHELWTDEATAPGQVWAGFRFIDVGPSDLTFIVEWVEAPGSEYS